MATDVLTPVLGTLSVLDGSGDSRIQWDPSNPAEVAKAEARFNEAPSRSAESSATVVSAVAVVQAGHDRRLERIPSRA